MDKLVNCFYKRPDAVTRLICFPWAGGGSLFNAQWGRLFDESVEVLSLRLAGRESRIGEPLPQSFDDLLDEIIDGLMPLLCEKRFAFFGHSFGSSVCYATAAKLKHKYGLEPIHLFVSGASAPHSAARYSIQKRLEMNDEEFLKWMASTQGTPPELLKNKEAMQQFLTPLKADLKLVANYVYEKPSTPALTCGLTCFDGTEDTPHDLASWKDLTSGDFSIHMLPGGHFYLKDAANEKALVQYISRYIEAAEIHYF